MATGIYIPDSHTENYYADRFFDIISEPKTKRLQQRILSIVKVPFISDTNRIFVNVDGCSILDEDKTKGIKNILINQRDAEHYKYGIIYYMHYKNQIYY